MQIKQRNFVSQSSDIEPPETCVKSYGITPDQKNLITFEELHDKSSNKDILI